MHCQMVLWKKWRSYWFCKIAKRLREHRGIPIESIKVYWTIEIGIGPICSIMKWYSIEDGLIGSKKIHTCTYFEEW
jgi:hypothetical protein